MSCSVVVGRMKKVLITSCVFCWCWCL